MDQALGKALAKAPADRFPSAAAFQQALTQAGAPPSLKKWFARRALIVAACVSVLTAVVTTVLLRRHGSPDQPGLSIAVLEFKNVGGDSTNEPFSYGMSDELTTALGKVEGLRVLARSAVIRFRGKDVSPQEVGRRLHVLYVLDGGVRMGGNRRRVSAQLINVAGGNEIWSDEYDRDAGDRDVFAVQDDITRAIVAALRVHLSGTASAALAKRSTDNPEAHDLYLQGRYFFARRESASLRKAQDYFERAIQKDSSYALAWSGLSDAYSHGSVFGYVAPRVNFPKAKAAALRALALDSALVEVHTSLGFIALFYDWDWSTAGREFDRALALDPRHAPAHLFRGWYFVGIDRMNDAVAELRTAVSLDPFDVVTNTRLASILVYARRYDEALTQLGRVLELNPAFFQLRPELARAYLLLHRCDEALRVLERVPQQPVTASALRGIPGWVYARCGHRAKALAEVNSLHSEVRQGHYVSHYSLATIQAGLGDSEQAFAELDSAYAERAWGVFTLRVDPALDNLRADPRFARLLKKVGPTS